jgi:hypothetical protein
VSKGKGASAKGGGAKGLGGESRPGTAETTGSTAERPPPRCSTLAPLVYGAPLLVLAGTAAAGADKGGKKVGK